jgi:RNA polymerase sigma-70 factor (ECF subfamily)
LANARQGSENALGRLLQGCRDYLLLIANRELGDEIRRKVAPSDLVQETMADAVRDFAGFQGEHEAQFLAWMRQILLNNLADAVGQFHGTAKRDISREREPEGELSNQRLTAALVDPQPTPFADLLATESRTHLLEALARLPERYRQVILLRNMELLTYVEIGQRMTCSTDSARKLWDRAIRHLTSELEKKDDVPGKPSRNGRADAGGADLAGGTA